MFYVLGPGRGLKPGMGIWRILKNKAGLPRSMLNAD